MKSRNIRFLAFGILVFLPLFVFADPLVPCGIISADYSVQANYLTATGCNFCYFAQLIQNIVNFLIMVAIPISVAMFAWAGIKFFTAGGSPKNISQAKKIFSSVFIGFIIAISGWLLVQVVLQTLTNSTFYTANSWTTLQCSALNNSRPRSYDIGTVLGSNSLDTTSTPNPQNPNLLSPNVGNSTPITNVQAMGDLVSYNANFPNNPINTASGVSYEGVNLGLMQSVMGDVSGAGAAGGVTVTSANDSTHVSGSQHAAGNALDIVPANNAAFVTYMQSSPNFTPVVNQVASGQMAFQDTNGVIWSYEGPGTAGSTGAHWHVSTTGN